MERHFEQIVYDMAEVLNSKKAEDILLIDVSKVTILADSFVICSGRVPNHVKLLSDELEAMMASKGIVKIRQEGYAAGRWIVLDFGDIIAHIFHREEREFYNIERLWTQEDNSEKYGDESSTESGEESNLNSTDV